MNRQIVPSMFLSVLIVCFFAVILFERDSPRRTRGNDRAANGKEAEAKHVASDPDDIAATPLTPRAPESKPQLEEEQKREPGKREGKAEQAVLPAIQGTAGASSAQATSRAAAQDKPAPEPQNVTQTPASKTPTPAPPPAKQSAPQIPAPNRSEGLPVRKPPSSDPVAESGPQQAFTAVQEGESLRDVAIRVYGSADDLDSLWRANRDVLPHKDSPLTAGSVLRTPTNKPGD